MKYKVVIHKGVLKYLSKLPENKKETVKKALKRLEKADYDGLGIIEMKGEWRGYRRFKIGNLRVIFWTDETERTMYVDYIGARGDIYKRPHKNL